MNLSPERKKLEVTPNCASRASAKSPRTADAVAFCMEAAWCEPFHWSASAAWQPAQAWAPTKFAVAVSADTCPGRSNAKPMSHSTVVASFGGQSRPLMVNSRQRISERDLGNLHQTCIGLIQLQYQENRTRYGERPDDQGHRHRRIEPCKQTEAKEEHRNPEDQHRKERPCDLTAGLLKHQQAGPVDLQAAL